MPTRKKLHLSGPSGVTEAGEMEMAGANVGACSPSCCLSIANGLDAFPGFDFEDDLDEEVFEDGAFFFPVIEDALLLLGRPS